jgi:hypothetical protein
MTSAVRAGLIGAGIGGASMFLLDPDRGARRRALVRDKAVRATLKTRDAAGATRRDLSNRLSGLQSRIRARGADGTVDDQAVQTHLRGWSAAAMLVAGASLAAGAVALAVTRARGNGGSPAADRASDTRTVPPAPVEEGAGVFITESGILCEIPEPEFSRDEFFS